MSPSKGLVLRIRLLMEHLSPTAHGSTRIGRALVSTPCASVFIRGPLFAFRKRQPVRVPQAKLGVYPEEVK